MKWFLVVACFLMCGRVWCGEVLFKEYSLSHDDSWKVKQMNSVIEIEFDSGDKAELYIVGVPSVEDATGAVVGSQSTEYTEAGLFYISPSKLSFDLREGWYIDSRLAYSEGSILYLKYESRKEIEEGSENVIRSLVSAIAKR